MSKTVLTEVSGFTPLIDSVVQRAGVVEAAVFGRMWRYCQMSDGVCKASLETIAGELNISVSTVYRHAKKLCDLGYIKDTTPNAKGIPHVYADTGLASVHVTIKATSVKMTDDLGQNDRTTSVKMTDKDSIQDTSQETPSSVAKDGLDTLLAFEKMKTGKEKEMEDVEKIFVQLEKGLHVNISRNTSNQQTVKKILKDGRSVEKWITWLMSDEWRATHTYLWANMDKVWQDFPQAFNNKLGSMFSS